MLLIHASRDPHARYSHYLAEILRAEGFCDFAEADLAQCDAAQLAQHDLVVLPRCIPQRAQTDLLIDYVLRGVGKLIALMPDERLISGLGLSPTYKAIRNGELQIDTARPELRGLCNESVQVIVPAVEWRSDTAEVWAHIHTGESQIAGVLHAHIGAGEVVLFAYDLAHAVARLRQGDPANADICASGLDGLYRPSELFIGQLDPRKLTLPQADVHTALLARVIDVLAPRPRLWYYPTAEQRSVMIMTSDDDWSTREQFDALLDGLRAHNAHCSFYIVPHSKLSKAELDAIESRDGHAFSVHPALETDLTIFPNIGEAQPNFVAEMLRENVARHQREYQRPVRTLRNHIVRWDGYLAAAQTLAELGVGMDCNYLSVSPFSLGYMTGSGRPLRFVEASGAVLPLFQQATQWTEECLIHPEFVFSERWSVEKALAETGAIIRRAAREFHTPVAINSHPVSYATYSAPLVQGVWAAAQAEGMPILSADEWLDWTAARDAVRLSQVNGRWVLHTPQPLAAMSVLLPAHTVGVTTPATTTQVLWGQSRQVLTLQGLSAGSYPILNSI